MATTNETLVQAKYLENVLTSQYSGSAVTTILDTVTLTNIGNADTTAAARLVESGGTSGADKVVLDGRTIAPGETYLCPELVGQVLMSGDALYMQAGAANSLVLRISGRVIA